MISEEKRGSERFKLDRPIVYAYLNSDKFFKADILNYSSGGVCFQSNHPIKAKEGIYIMTDDSPIDDLSSEFYEGCFAEVIWCKKFSGFYKIGAKYAEA
jgi:hypothetical protein